MIQAKTVERFLGIVSLLYKAEKKKVFLLLQTKCAEAVKIKGDHEIIVMRSSVLVLLLRSGRVLLN